MGRIQLWRLLRVEKQYRIAAHTPMKNARTNSQIVHAGACWEEKR